MRRPSALPLYLAALLLGAFAMFAVAFYEPSPSPVCTCVLGGHYEDPDAPEDCAVHGPVTP